MAKNGALQKKIPSGKPIAKKGKFLLFLLLFLFFSKKRKRSNKR
jgi:hypothetical protein